LIEAERPLGGRFVQTAADDEFGRLWTLLFTSPHHIRRRHPGLIVYCTTKPWV